MLEPVADVQAALWGFDRLAPFNDHNVALLVPEGFERYVRILHPGSWLNGQQHVPIRWAEMAASTGCQAHALMQWVKIATPTFRDHEVCHPDEGTIPVAVSTPLLDLLAPHTGSAACWVCLWPGWGRDYYLRHVPLPTKSVDTGAREWDLFRAPLEEAFAPFLEDQTASLIWAADRSWWLTTCVDLDSTYIGGSARLIESVLAADKLEAWPAQPEDDVTWEADRLNSVENPIDDVRLRCSEDDRWSEDEKQYREYRKRSRWWKIGFKGGMPKDGCYYSK